MKLLIVWLCFMAWLFITINLFDWSVEHSLVIGVMTFIGWIVGSGIVMASVLIKLLENKDAKRDS